MADILAPMSGKVWKVLVEVGASVGEDDEVAVLEAMKMEIPVVSPEDGTIKSIRVKEGDAVEAESVIMELE
ncbi:MAG: acetyl-CoA carboxylase biotin carboxyl carrier protein subunit [Deltaproteobacteria bacterium]|nr:acetyl-CoA carboxylase biotin carboxyl carrier protein subunit [Deltaproteobacteria bacterium]